MVAVWRGSEAEFGRGRGYVFLMVMLFSLLKSMHGHKVPSFFATKKSPVPRGEEEGRIMPATRESLI